MVIGTKKSFGLVDEFYHPPPRVYHAPHRHGEYYVPRYRMNHAPHHRGHHGYGDYWEYRYGPFGPRGYDW